MIGFLRRRVPASLRQSMAASKIHSISYSPVMSTFGNRSDADHRAAFGYFRKGLVVLGIGTGLGILSQFDEDHVPNSLLGNYVVHADEGSGGRRKRKRRLAANALCYAAKTGDMSTLQALAEKDDFDPDARHELGWAAIHVAVVENRPTIVKFLLDHGANVNIQDMTGPYCGKRRKEEFSSKIRSEAPTQKFTPLHYAATLLNEDLARLLLAHGADPAVRDALKRTPEDWLRGIKDVKAENMIDLLEEDREMYLANKGERDRQARLAFPLEEQLKERIVGQLAPITSVSSAVRRKQNGWHDEDHPLVFLFLGSSGVGKTELAKVLSEILHKDNKAAFIRIDMSEFQSKHEVAKFIGSPPGYVGHEEGGQLTKRLAECPDAIVLLDEVEKAHPDVLTIMLQLFDEGRITDGKGETVICKDAVFVMTSNLAQTEIADEAEQLRREAKEKALSSGLNDEATSLSREFIEEQIRPILKSHFQRDEFLGRINEILFFLPFNTVELKELTIRQLKKWQVLAKKRHNIDITWSDEIIPILQDGYNLRYGARSLQHEVERRVVNQIARAHELGKVTNNGKVYVKKGENDTIEIVPSKGEPLKKGWFS